MSNSRKCSVLFAIAIISLLALSAVIASASATTPTERNWRGQGAMANWFEAGDTGYVFIEAVFAEQLLGSGAIQPNVLYVTVTHTAAGGGMVSEAKKTLTSSEFTWTADHLHVSATLTFPWVGSPATRDHTITIDWDTTGSPTTTNYFIDETGYQVPVTGQFKAATATIEISAVGSHHLDTYNSKWAITGAQSTLNTCDGTGNEKAVFNAGNTIYGSGVGYSPSKEYPVYVVQDTTWFAYKPIPARISGTTDKINTDSTGNIPTASLYPGAAPGKYDIVIDVNTNGQYDLGTDVLCDNIVTTGGFFVVPEYAYGALIALISCFAAFALLYGRKLSIAKVAIP